MVNASFDSVAAETVNSQEFELPIVCLPSKGVRIIDTATDLATANRSQMNPEAMLYNRGGSVVTVERDRNGALMLKTLEPKRACSQFEQFAMLGEMKKGKDENKGTFEPKICTSSVASMILTSNTFLDSLPKINLITNTPVIIEGKNNECKIINSYDEATGIFPTGKPVEDISLEYARKLLNEVIADFHYQTHGDKSRALAALLSPALVAGGILKARNPIMMLEADKSQSGKGFFSKLLGTIYNEVPTTVAQRGGGVGSLDESFDAALCSGRQLIVLDNLRGKLNSPQIEAFMTADIHMARVPFAGQVEVEPCRYFIMATSNNFETTVDMANRSSFVRIYKREEGYSFQSFEDGNILQHIKANQPRYLGAVFAVIKEWVRLGKPKNTTSHHDFRDWSHALDWIVQNILHGAPLMEGHKEAQLTTRCPELNWLKKIYTIVKEVATLNKELTAYEIAEHCEMGDIELPGALGVTSIHELDEKRKVQVFSQIGRRINSFFRKLGDGDTINVGSFILKRGCKKITYQSGKSDIATVYTFLAVA